MIIDAKFIFTVAQLAIEFGEHVIEPIIAACHQSETQDDKDILKKHVGNLVNQHKIDLKQG